MKLSSHLLFFAYLFGGVLHPSFMAIIYTLGFLFLVLGAMPLSVSKGKMILYIFFNVICLVNLSSRGDGVGLEIYTPFIQMDVLLFYFLFARERIEYFENTTFFYMIIIAVIIQFLQFLLVICGYHYFDNNHGRFFGITGDQLGWITAFWFLGSLNSVKPLTSLLLLFSTLLSGTVGALAMICMFWIVKRKIKLVNVFLVLVSVGILAMTDLRFANRIFGFMELTSISHRLVSLEIGMNHFLNNTWFGVGYGMFELESYSAYGNTIYNSVETGVSNTVFVSAQNTILQALVDFGLVGFLLLLVLSYGKIKGHQIFMLISIQTAVFLIPGNLLGLIFFTSKGEWRNI